MTVYRLFLWVLLGSWGSGFTATTQDSSEHQIFATPKYNNDGISSTEYSRFESPTLQEEMSLLSTVKTQEHEPLSSYYIELKSGQLFIPRSKLVRLLRALERLRMEHSELDFSEENIHRVLKALEANSDDSHSGSSSLSDSIAIPPQTDFKGACSSRCFEVIRDLIYYGSSLPYEDITTERFSESDQRVEEANVNKDGSSTLEANTVLSVQKREASPPPPAVGNENNRKNGPTIDEIISGIVQLLGGNVQVSKPSLGQRIRPTLPFNRKPSSKRVNHRGPPKFTPSVISVSLVSVTSSTIMTTPQLPVIPTESPSVLESSRITNQVLSSIIPSGTSEQPVFPTLSSSVVTDQIVYSGQPENEVKTQALPSSSIQTSHSSSSYTLIEVPAFNLSKSKTSTESLTNRDKYTHFSSVHIMQTPVPQPVVPTSVKYSTILSTETLLSISTLPNNPVADVVKVKDDQIVYGKPFNVLPPVNLTTQAPSIQPSPPAVTTVEDVTITGTGSLPKKDKPSNNTTLNAPTGKPYVIPVEIEEVRPFIGSFPPGPFPSGNGPGRKPPDFPRQQGSGLNNRPPSSPRPSGNGRPAKPSSGPIRNQPGLVRPPTRNKPNTPLVRIDTCIVGDDATCDVQLNERCVTEAGVSSCHCRPGFARSFARGPCIPVISVSVSLKVDRFGNHRLSSAPQFLDPNSDDHLVLEHEVKQAMSSLLSYTSYSRTFMGSNLNRMYGVSSGVVMNATIQLEDNEANRHPAVLQRLLQQEVLNAITSRNLNVGDSSLFVDAPPTPGPLVEDINECELSHTNDCSANGICQNTFGSFRCICKPGYMDKFPDDQWKSGRTCAACSPSYCNNHGECFVKDGRRECKCRGNYIGSRCEIDGEVLGVALGASLSALIIIILTLICLCVWNRKWKRSQPKGGLSLAGTYPRKAGEMGIGHFPRPSVEDRLRWAHITDSMGNVYVPADGHPGNASLSPPLPSLPPPASCPSAKHIYATPSRVLMQKVNMSDDRGRLYGQLRPPKSHGSCASGFQPPSGYYDLNEFPLRENYGNVYSNPASKSFYGFEK